MARSLSFAAVFLLPACNPVPQAPEKIEVEFDQWQVTDQLRGVDSYLAGDNGTLGYENGCMYLEKNGGRTGIVLPPDTSFDGKILNYRDEKYEVGRKYAIGGFIVANPNDGRFKCRTEWLVMANAKFEPMK
jgi:hypothetical protein